MEEDIAYSLVNLLPRQRDGMCLDAVFKIIQTLGLDPSYFLDPMIEVHCKIQGGKKVMCLVQRVLYGKLMTHWFDEETSVNEDNYLEKLQTFVWPEIKHKVNSKQRFFQQDGAPPH